MKERGVNQGLEELSMSYKVAVIGAAGHVGLPLALVLVRLDGPRAARELDTLFDHQ